MAGAFQFVKKLILNEDVSGYKKAELYFEDPCERRDRASEFPDIVRALEQNLPQIKWPDGAAGNVKQMDPAVLRKLKALGYFR